MRRTGALVVLSCSVIWLFFWASPGVARDPAEAIVSVVGLDEQGQPGRHGLGILVGKDGLVLTSASILTNQRGGIVKTASGELSLIKKIVHWDIFQDLALVQLASKNLAVKPAEISARLQPPEKVWVGAPRPGPLKEARVINTMPFSPRLILIKLEPNIAAEPGAPVLNDRGELLGMLHSFGGAADKPQGLQFYLVRGATRLPVAKTDQENIGWEQVAESRTSSAYRAFWEGVAASLRQEWQRAQERFAVAAAPPENLPEAYYGRGVARFHLGDFPGAVHDLEAANRGLPGYALAFLWLGKTWERQNNPEAAKQAYEQAVAKAPELSEAWLRLGELAYHQGNMIRARECLERALVDFSQAAKSWWYLGNIARTQGRQKDALTAFNQAIKLDPDFYQAYLEGGKLLVEDLGRPKEAVGLLQQAVRLAPQQPLPRYYLGLAQLLSWNKGGAWEQYFALQELSPKLAAALATVLERSQ